MFANLIKLNHLFVLKVSSGMASSNGILLSIP